MKSERLKKLETELRDLEQWLKLGLVPKKDIEKHKEEIRFLQHKIEEEKERLQFLKESGDIEEYTMPKRSQGRAGYPDTSTLSDIELTEEATGLTDASLEMDTDAIDIETYAGEERSEEVTEEVVRDEEEEEEEDEDPFSDRNRWRRGIIDPDADEW
jgi:DNA mismatch repair ATPase MutS